MSSPPLPDLDALSADVLKRLVARLLAPVVALEEENRPLRVEDARLKDPPNGPRPATGRVALLTARKDAFHAETDAILEAGLATARWVTVDDTGARHAGRDETTTHVGDDRFAWFATRPSKSRLNFLGLLRAGRPDYVLNAAAVAYMLEHGASEAVIATLLAHER